MPLSQDKNNIIIYNSIPRVYKEYSRINIFNITERVKQIKNLVQYIKINYSEQIMYYNN